MARLARLVVPGYPYHITQRGNRRQPVFFCEADYRLYLDLLREQSRRWQLQVWAYCLMPNHVHLIVVPDMPTSLRGGLGETHRRYTSAINFREGWRGYLWQGRFASYLLDEPYLAAALRYVERNPVAARLVERPADYPWSSAYSHVTGLPDPVLTPCFLIAQVQDWAAFLAGPKDGMAERLEHHSRTGRPLGDSAFLQRLEQRTGRRLKPQSPGRKPKQ